MSAKEKHQSCDTDQKSCCASTPTFKSSFTFENDEEEFLKHRTYVRLSYVVSGACHLTKGIPSKNHPLCNEYF